MERAVERGPFYLSLPVVINLPHSRYTLTLSFPQCFILSRPGAVKREVAIQVTLRQKFTAISSSSVFPKSGVVGVPTNNAPARRRNKPEDGGLALSIHPTRHIRHLIDPRYYHIYNVNHNNGATGDRY